MRKLISIVMGLCLCCILVLLDDVAGAMGEKVVRLQQGMGALAKESYYDTLQEAFDQVAYNHAQITLLYSVQESVDYTGGYSVTLDLNGNVLTGKGETALIHEGFGVLTLKSGVPGGRIEGTKQGILVKSQRGIVIQSGEYWALAPDGIAIVNENGKVTIQEKDGTVWIQGGMALLDRSDQVLELDGGHLIGTAMGFAMEKLGGSLVLDGGTQIQGEMGGLLLRTGTNKPDLGVGEKSTLHLDGTMLQAVQPEGVALAVYAAPGWDVAVDGDGIIAGDTALRLEGGTLTVLEGTQAQLDGKVAGGPGLLLQGGWYKEAPKTEWVAQGLYPTVNADGWYILGTTPPTGKDSQDQNTGTVTPESPADTDQQGGLDRIEAGQPMPAMLQEEGDETDILFLFLPKTGQRETWLLPALLAAGSLTGLLVRDARKPGQQEYRKSGKDH